MSVIYLDNAATSAVDPTVVDAMTTALADDYGNPSSRHAVGLSAQRRVRAARRGIANRFGVAPERLVFCSGGTEALALALLGGGVRKARKQPGHVLVSAIEHSAVLGTGDTLNRAQGHEVERVPVTSGGFVDADAVVERLRDDTFLVAVMHVNNETGIIQPVAEIARAVKAVRPDCAVLVDAVQSFGVLPTELEALGADLVCISAHKLHGPKGVGCIALSKSARLAPLWGGGDQEGGRRPGTENVPGIVGLGAAVELCGGGDGEYDRLRQACDRLATAIVGALDGAYAIGDASRRAPHIVDVAVPGVRSETLVNALGQRGVFVSSGSACHARSSLRSHVLEAMAVPRDHGAIRISPSRRTANDDVEAAAAIIGETLTELRPS